MNVVIPTEEKRMLNIKEKVHHGERLSPEDGVFLYASDDLLSIGQMANTVNQRKNGKKVYFIENMSLYFTNVCEAHCAFCNFRKDEGQEGAYTLSGQQMID
jgi:aminodeoxyfutalosine synthase